MIAVDREKPANAGSFELQHAAHRIWLAAMDDRGQRRAEDPGEHVKEMNPNVRRDPARLRRVTLPAVVVPLSTRRDVGQVDLRTGAGAVSLAQRGDDGMQTQLE